MSQPGLPPVPPPPSDPPPPPPGPSQPFGSGPPPQPPGRRKRAWAIGGAAAAALIIVPGVAVAWSVLDGGGTQPHDVLPGDAIGYVRVDLDPSATQKIQAFRFLNQFPLFDANVDIDEDDDLRELLVDAFADETGCPIDFEDDVEPWAGERAGAAFLPPADDQSDPGMVLAVQTGDEEAAEEALSTIVDCEGGGTEIGTIYLDGYLLITDTAENAEAYAATAQESPLADDAAFVEAMERLGDPGIVSAWMSVGDLLDVLPPGALTSGLDPYGEFGVPGRYDPGSAFGEDSSPMAQIPSDEELDELTRKMVDGSYRSVALTLRFDDDYAEVAAVAAGDLYQDGASGLEVDVPADTTVVIGVANGSELMTDQWANMLDLFPAEMADMMDEMSDVIGITLPDDLATLAGDNAVFALDASELDVDAIASGDLSSLDLGVKGSTDPEAFDEVWAKLADLADQSGFPLDMVTKETTDDGYVVAANPDYAETLIEGGDLASSDTYTTAVKDAAEADGVFYLNFDTIEDHLIELAGGELSPDEAETIRRFAAIGAAQQFHDGYAEMSFRISTK